MSNQCHICQHESRLEIDRAIVGGGRLSDLAVNFGVEYHSLRSHAKSHLTRQLVKVYEQKGILEGDQLLQTINNIIAKSEKIFDRNYKLKKDFLALKALDSQRNTIQLLSNISAQLHAAKIAELRLEEEKKGNSKGQQEQQYAESLTVLSNEELPVYQRFVFKLINKNKDRIISNGRVLVYNHDADKGHQY